MEHSVIWSKTLLSVLKTAPAVNKHLDKLITLRAVKVPGVGVEAQSDYCGTYQQVDKILMYIETKKRVLNLLYIVDEIMSKVHVNYRKALYLRYKYNKIPSDIQQLMDCTLRTYFRYLSQGINQFTEIRQKLGYTDEYIETNYPDDHWLFNLKTKTAEEHKAHTKRTKDNGNAHIDKAACRQSDNAACAEKGKIDRKKTSNAVCEKKGKIDHKGTSKAVCAEKSKACCLKADNFTCKQGCGALCKYRVTCPNFNTGQDVHGEAEKAA